jgi:hypothetical protein
MHLHWRRLTKLKNAQKACTKVAMLGKELPPAPLLVTITRVGPRLLDDDNLATACKFVRDQIAAAVGIDDGSALYTWRYAQTNGDYGVDVEIVSR